MLSTYRYPTRKDSSGEPIEHHTEDGIVYELDPDGIEIFTAMCVLRDVT